MESARLDSPLKGFVVLVTLGSREQTVIKVWLYPADTPAKNEKRKVYLVFMVEHALTKLTGIVTSAPRASGVQCEKG